VSGHFLSCLAQKAKNCAAGLKMENLSVLWKSNGKIWMTRGVITESLNEFDGKMRRENRTILLFIGATTAHPHLRCKNIKIVFSPKCSLVSGRENVISEKRTEVADVECVSCRRNNSITDKTFAPFGFSLYLKKYLRFYSIKQRV
jgi:hypothetical protein